MKKQYINDKKKIKLISVIKSSFKTAHQFLLLNIWNILKCIFTSTICEFKSLKLSVGLQ